MTTHPFWSFDTEAGEDVHDCEGEGSFIHCDDSFDHEFGTERITPYRECNICGKTSEY